LANASLDASIRDGLDEDTKVVAIGYGSDF
jgi:hypothetical protein